MLDAYIYSGLRTPFGRQAGALAPVRPDDLAAKAIQALLARSPFTAGQVEDVVLGCACQAGEDSRNVARHCRPAVRPAVHHPRSDGQPAVFQRPGGGAGRRARGHLRRGRAVHRRRRREHEPCAIRRRQERKRLRPRVQGVRFGHRRALSQTPGSRNCTATTPCRRPPTTWPGISI